MKSWESRKDHETVKYIEKTENTEHIVNFSGFWLKLYITYNTSLFHLRYKCF